MLTWFSAKEFCVLRPGSKDPLFSPVSWNLKLGCVYKLDGDNGVGKSTLMSFWMGHSIGVQGWHELGCDPKSFRLLPQLSAWSNNIPYTLGDLSPNLPSALAKKLWNTASGGERAQCLIAKALHDKCQVLFLDETAQALDQHGKRTLVAALEQHVQERGLCVVYVDHSQALPFSSAVNSQRLLLRRET